MIFSLALRELKYSSPKLRLVIFILLVGFIGPFFTSSLKTSIADYLESSSRRILSADLTVNSMREFAPKEIDWLQNGLKATKLVQETEFVTMARGRDVATLVEVKAEENNFPVIGGFRFTGEEPLKNSRGRDASDLNKDERIAWTFPEVLAQLGLKVGDSISIGKSQFRVAASLEEAPGSSRTAGFAPRVFIGRKWVDETGLAQYGAQVYHRIYLELPENLDSEAAAKKVKVALISGDVFTRTPDDAIQGFERFFRFFNIYLVAIAMIVFVLSWMSAFYILQIFLQERLRNAAIFMINGSGRIKVAFLYSVQVFLLIAFSFLISGLFVQLAAVIANRVLADQLPAGFLLRVSWQDWLSLAGVAIASAVAFNAPFFVRLRMLRLQTLLSEDALGLERLPRLTALTSYAPLLILFLGLSAWLMDSVIDALRLAGGMAAAALIGWGLGRFLFSLFFRTVRARPGLTRLVATSLARGRFGVNLCFLALVLVALALNLVPHLLESVTNEVQPLQGKEIPALFLFNIPESALEDVKTFAAKQKAELRFLSPMVLGRLLKINGKDPESDQLQRFPVRLSYRSARIPSETIIKGRDLPSSYDPASNAPAEISVEQKFAERNSIHIGDEVDFEVQSLPIKTKVTSLRHIQWTSFNPNFFIMFQPGVLDDAPKTWISNVNLTGGPEQKVQMQYELTRDFPDISVIDIGSTIDRVLEIARSVIGPVRAAAWIAVVMSFLILIGIVSHNLKLRDAEIDIEKLLGADRDLIRKLIVGEYAVTAIFAWLVGAGSALGLAWLVARQALDIQLRVSGLAFALSAALIVLATVIIARVSADRVLNLRGASRKL